MCSRAWIRADCAPGPILSTLFTENEPHNKAEAIIVMSLLEKLIYREVKWPHRGCRGLHSLFSTAKSGASELCVAAAAA